MKSVLSILLGILIAWVIVTFTYSRRSNYLEHLVLQPAEFTQTPMQNSALIGAGLASPTPSVMDAVPASMANPVMMPASMPTPMMVPTPTMTPMMVPASMPTQGPYV